MLTATALDRQIPDGRKILDGFDIKVKPGELVALIGPSGSGKTTALKALCLLDEPTAGKIKLDDKTYEFPLAGGIENISPKPWPHVTAVFQQFFLWPHLTLKQNILLPVEDKYPPEQVKKHLDELVELFDMRHFINRYPNETSGGQKQRAALARALMLNPKYILLDEITSALDVEQNAKVLECLQILKKRGIGILLITHLINFARQAADQVVFIDEGKVLETGSAKILDKPQHPRFKQFMEMVKLAS